jgi:winged helix DNA-binding protein
LRRRNHRLMGGTFKSAVEAVGWLGAVQSQDYPLAKWSLGTRVAGLDDPDVDTLLASNAILRTHILRPTWHFVLPADIRWMMALTGPRIMRKGQPPGVAWPAPATVMRGVDAMARALAGGNRLSRAQLAKLIVAQGIVATELDTIPMFMTAELELVVVSGGLAGKVQTYALVDEIVPPAPAVARGWALAELTRRYFTSHGPATVGDFVWWSGLTVTDTRRGLEENSAAGRPLESFDVDGTAFWWAGDTSDGTQPDEPSPTAHFLQAYDEYVVAYRSPRTPINIAGIAPPSALQRPPLTHAVILDGQLIGFWRRELGKDRVRVQTSLLKELDADERRALQLAADRYGRFIGLPAEVSP